MKASHIFVSQRKQSIYEAYGCSAACLMMLLRQRSFTPLPSWEELCLALDLKKKPLSRRYHSDDPEVGLYPEALFRYVIEKNVHYELFFTSHLTLIKHSLSVHKYQHI